MSQKDLEGEKHNHPHEHHPHGHHAHGHGHEHKPDPGQGHGGKPLISVATHETSTVGSLRCAIGKPYNESLEVLEGCMKKTAAAVTKLGGIIGHIKFYLASEGDSCLISIVEEEPVRKEMRGHNSWVEGVAIVFGIEPEELREILEDAFHDPMEI